MCSRLGARGMANGDPARPRERTHSGSRDQRQPGDDRDGRSAAREQDRAGRRHGPGDGWGEETISEAERHDQKLDTTAANTSLMAVGLLES